MPASARARALPVLVAVLAAHASVQAAPSPRPSERALALERVEITHGLLTHDLTDAISAVARLGGFTAEPVSAPPATIDRGLPSGTAGPIADLLGAVHRAEELAAAAVRMDAPQLERHRRRADMLLDAWREDVGREPPGLSDLRGSVGARVDTRLLASAAATLAEAIEVSLPDLRAFAASAGGPELRVAGCELGEVPGVLCLGGTGSNTYERDYALVVDLGGDDVHANSAGGADPLGNGLPVAVTVDVGGNDTYRRPADSRAQVAQGAGLLGVGVLVDAAGNDVYDVEVSAPNTDAGGQGYGESGAGILADLGGSDRYSIVDTAPGVQSVDGQAAAGLGGFALSLDTAGDDVYTLASRPTPAPSGGGMDLGQAEASGFGVGSVGGVAAFADVGGTDSMSIEAIAGPAPSGQAQGGGSSSILGYGGGGAGIGVAVGGGGATVWSARAEYHGPAGQDTGGSAFIGGSGQGALGGFGALHDVGGDDTYRSLALTHSVQERSIGDGCDCARVDAAARAGIATVLGTGYGAAGGVGVLQDVGGDDRYLATATSYAEATAHDGRTNPPSTGSVSARSEATTADPDLNVQGAGVIGAGYLMDGAGADVYEARALSEARAIATAAHPDAMTEAVATSGPADTFAQAVGTLGGSGELRDSGGADSYIGESRSIAFASPATAATPSPATASVQGSVELGGRSHFTDLDGGAADFFFSAPADTACLGTRGEGIWGDCGIGVGTGLSA